MPTFGERMRTLRHAYGARGDRTTCAAWARELGVNRQTVFSWETKGIKTPSIGIDGLTECLERVEAIRRKGVSPRSLAAWALTGEGEPPSAAPPAAGEPKPDQLSTLSTLLERVRDGALNVSEAAITIRTLSRAGYFITFLATVKERRRAS